MTQSTDDLAIRSTAEGVLIAFHVHPGAKSNSLNGYFGEALKLQLKAPPVDGKANEALLKLLAKWLNMPRSALSIKQGMASRNKLVLIRSGNIESIKKLLGEHNE